MLTGQLTTPERVVVIFIICSFCGTHVTAICGSTVIYSKDATKERSSPPCHQLHAHFSVPTLILVPSHVYSVYLFKTPYKTPCVSGVMHAVRK